MEGWLAGAGALEIRDEEQAARTMTRGDLEASQQAYARVQVTAPPEVSRELREASLAEASARAGAAELRARGQAAEAAQAEARADALSIRATELEGQHEVYQSWQETTAGQRTAAEAAARELARRAEAKRVEQETEAQPERQSLWEQIQQDMAAAEALEAKLDRERAPQTSEPTPEAGPEYAAPGPEPVPEPQNPEPEYPEPGPQPETGEEAEAREPESAARAARIDEHTALVREALAEQSQRDASREAHLRQERQAAEQGIEARAWQPGTRGPGWNRTEAEAPEAAAQDAEAGV
jgi:colicin import membrane protein